MSDPVGVIGDVDILQKSLCGFSKVVYKNRQHRRIYGYQTHSFSIYSADPGSHSGFAALPSTDKLPRRFPSNPRHPPD